MAAEGAIAIRLIADQKLLRVTLDDERWMWVSLNSFPRLRDATSKELGNFRFIGDMHGIHWPDLDEDVSIASLLQRPWPVTQLGPLTAKLVAGAKWENTDAFPGRQEFANDIEAVLVFLQSAGRLDAFIDKVQRENKPNKRNNLLAEARAAFWLAQNGFRIVEWEPIGEGGRIGEFSCTFEGSPAIFVEVKQPGWQSELIPANFEDLSAYEKELRLARKAQGKYILGLCEGRAVGSHIHAMDVVRRNVLPKLAKSRPNLAIIVDDFYCSPVALPNLAQFVEQEFSHHAHAPDKASGEFTYERLGGVLFVNVQAKFGAPVDYLVSFVANSQVLTVCALPPSVSSVLCRLTEESSLRD